MVDQRERPQHQCRISADPYSRSRSSRRCCSPHLHPLDVPPISGLHRVTRQTSQPVEPARSARIGHSPESRESAMASSIVRARPCAQASAKAASSSWAWTIRPESCSSILAEVWLQTRCRVCFTQRPPSSREGGRPQRVFLRRPSANEERRRSAASPMRSPTSRRYAEGLSQ